MEHTYCWYSKQQSYFFWVPLPKVLACPAYWPAALGCLAASSELNYLVKIIILALYHYFCIPSLSLSMAPLPFLSSPCWSYHCFLLLPQQSDLMSHHVPTTLLPHCSSHQPGTATPPATKLLPKPQSWSLQKFSLLICPSITAQATGLHHTFHSVISVRRKYWGLPISPMSF